MRRYRSAEYKGRWFNDHDCPRVSRRWAIWLLRELGIHRYGRRYPRSY